MDTTSFSEVLQQLSLDYYNHQIDKLFYRTRRREWLEQVDQYYNGRVVSVREAGGIKDDPEIHSAVTQPFYQAEQKLDDTLPSFVT